MRSRIFTSLVLIIFLAVPFVHGRTLAGEDAEIIGISSMGSGSSASVVIRVRGSFGNEVFKLSNPERLVLDLSPVGAISAPTQIEINAGGLLKVRAGQYKPQVARLVFDLENTAVNYKIDRTGDGLKVSFWKAEKDALRPDERAPITTTAPQTPAKPVSNTNFSDESERRFFVRIGGGIGAGLKSTSTFTKTSSLYGETSTSTENYKMKSNTPSSLMLGMFSTFMNTPVKIGLSAEYWNLKAEGNFSFSLPHPTVANSPRTVTMASDLKANASSFTIFGLFRILANNRLTMFAGPEVGYVKGRYNMLDDILIDEEPPYAADDVIVTPIYTRHSISGIQMGVLGSLEYALSKHLSLTLDLKAFLANLKVEDLTDKLDLSQAEAQLGLQYSF